MKLFFRIFFLWISFNLTYAQSPTCENASAMCSGQGGPYLNTHTGTPGGNQAGYGPITACGGSNSHGNNGSLGSTPRPAWFYFQIGQSGPIDLNMQQFNTSNTGIDVDFALWGPFSSNNLADICNSLSGFPGTTYTGPCNLVDASYSTTFNETIHFPNAVAGEFYLLLVTNFSGAQGTYTINQVNVTPSSGQISCDIVCGIDLGPDQLFCSSTINNFNLVANYLQAPTVVGTPTFSWYLHNGTSFVLQTTTTTNTLNVNQDGIWKVAVVRPGCTDLAEDEIEIRFDSPPSPNQPDNLEAPAGLCEYTFDLTSVEIDLLSPALPADYVIKYYLNEPDCFIGNANFIPNPTAFTVTTTTTIYVRIENIGNAICADANQFFDLVIDCIPASCFLNLTSAPATTNQSICIGQPIQNITYTYGDDATNVTATGLPTGLSFSTSAGVVTISGTPTQMGTFNYQLETVGCTPSIVKTGTITINSLPNVTSLTSNSPICLGQDAVFTINGTAGATVGYTINGGAPLSTTLNATGQVDITVTAPTADVTLVLSNVSLGTCSTTLTNSATVIVKPVPDVTSITSNTPICSGEDAEFVITGTTDAVVTYSLNGGTPTTTTLTGGTSTIIVPNATSNQQISVTSVSYNGCSNAESLSETVVVNSTFGVSSLTSNSPICLGTDAVFTINGTPGAIVSYSIDGGAVTPVTILPSGQVTVTVAAPTTDVTIVLSNIALGSCSAVINNTATVVVKPVPDVTSVTTNSPICSGNTATFTINGTPDAIVTYLLNGGAPTATTLTGGTATISIPNAQSNQQLEVTLVAYNGCSNIESYNETIVVNTTPTVSSLTSNSPICLGSDAVFTIQGTAGAVVNYSINNVAAVPGVTIPVSGVATVTVTAPIADVTILLSNIVLGTCSTVLTNTTTVVVKPVPDVTSVTTNTPICSGNTATFTINGTPNAVVTYSLNGGTATTTTITATGTIDITIPNAQSNQQLEVTLVAYNGCSNIESYNETIVVNTTPTVSSLTSNSPICLGSNAVFTINGTAGADVSYTINSGATLTATLTSGQAVITIPAPTADVTILLSEVVLGSCSKTVTNTATVVVKPLPTVTSLITNSPICSGNTATFTINGTPNAVVTYSLNGATATTTTLSATGVGTVSLTNATSNVSISLSLVNNGTCSTPLNLTENINVLALPVVTNLTSNSPICSGEDAEFTITGTANSIVSYSLNGTTTTVTLNESGNSIVPISNATVNQTISLSNVFDGNCNNVLTNTATVIVNALPSSPTIASISETYCIGEEMVFNVTGGNATETVTYTVNGGANQILNLDASGNGVITLSNPAAVVVIDLVSITNGSCSKSLSASDEAEVISCEIPKGISPGNDNKNDEWDLTGYNVKKVEIFNRYGTKVYSKTNYTNEWKGQSDNGNELPDGTYYYVVEFNQGPTKTGWVYINREQ